jgi:hypothetical protein
MTWRIADSMPDKLSPVITTVGGASPKPVIPLSHVTFTKIASAVVTVLNAVLKGLKSGTAARNVSMSLIIKILPPLLDTTFNY